ncbi:MAG: ATP-binding protein [Anaerolinea sp.]|nr:ATP-binding protein [Anaerolinea sp.]
MTQRGMLYNKMEQDQKRSAVLTAQAHFHKFVQDEQYVGDVYAISYESAIVLIHDFYRQKVGGIPSLCFLLATRVNPADEVDYKKEDSSVILLRVMDAAPTPNSAEAERIRFEAAQRMSGEKKHWDEAGAMDGTTAHLLSFAAVKCRVIGTFFLDKRAEDAQEDDIVVRFGSDISNYYPNRGLKVYKPNAEALKAIINYRDPSRSDQLSDLSVTVGEVRYASTNRSFQGVSNVTVDLMPGDLLRQKTALFGMTRTGKSNTTKIVLQSVFELRFDPKNPQRIGQIVFDPNGEYANENVQDNNSAIKNVWKSHKDGKPEDVVTYGITQHPNDPKRQLMLLNFHAADNLQIGKEIIDAGLAGSGSIYVNNFRQVMFAEPDSGDPSGKTRHSRRVLAYRALLAKAGFAVPKGLVAQTNGLFNSDLLQTMQQAGQTEPSFASAAATLSKKDPSWADLASAFTALSKFIKTSEYAAFEVRYINRPNGSGNAWADEDFKKILGMFEQPNGARLIGAMVKQHTPDRDTDYAPAIYRDLAAGKLIIIDQSSGDPGINKSSADRIMWYIFRQNQALFRDGKEPPDILVYVEEAHNLLPAGNEMDLEDVWVRTAKEGAKFRIGLVYATQEVSSIQRNILKNTANWFIGHLNNTDETKELCKFYDFEDFEPSIRRAQDRGFMRVKTLSNLFVIPVQIRRFEIKG